MEVVPKFRRRVTARGGTSRRGGYRKSEKAIRRIAKSVVSRQKETHDFVVNTSYDESTTTATFIQLSGVNQGTDDDQRIGEKIRPLYLDIKGHCNRKNTATTTTDSIRVIVFIWRPDTAIDSPTEAKLLQDDTYQLLSPVNYDMPKATVLYDRIFDMPAYDVGQSPSRWYQRFRIRIPSRKLNNISFNEGALTGKHQLYVYHVGAQASGTSSSQFSMFSRLRFKDM